MPKGKGVKMTASSSATPSSPPPSPQRACWTLEEPGEGVLSLWFPGVKLRASKLIPQVQPKRQLRLLLLLLNHSSWRMGSMSSRPLPRTSTYLRHLTGALPASGLKQESLARPLHWTTPARKWGSGKLLRVGLCTGRGEAAALFLLPHYSSV